MEQPPFFNIGKILIPGAGAATNFQGAQVVFERAKANVCHTLVTLYVSLNRREEARDRRRRRRRRRIVGGGETQASVHERKHEHVTNITRTSPETNTHTHNQHEARGAEWLRCRAREERRKTMARSDVDTV
jgi:hypothetical protein